MPQPTASMTIPGPLAVALQTGRPELARLIVNTKSGPLTAEEATQVSNFAEAMVRSIQEERDITVAMYDQVRVAIGNVRGALRTFDRIEDAFRIMSAGGDPIAVREALRNPNSNI